MSSRAGLAAAVEGGVKAAPSCQQRQMMRS
jgi:hypothetical protein